MTVLFGVFINDQKTGKYNHINCEKANLHKRRPGALYNMLYKVPQPFCAVISNC